MNKMKHRFTFFIVLTFFAFYSKGQHSIISIETGYSFAKSEYANERLGGFKINGFYEYKLSDSKFSHGILIGYALLNGTTNQWGINQEIHARTVPILYQLNSVFGKKKLNLTLKEMLGIQSSRFYKNGYQSYDKSSIGIAFGVDLGLRYNLSESLFIACNYDFLKMSKQDVYYSNGILQSVKVGIGIQL